MTLIDRGTVAVAFEITAGAVDASSLCEALRQAADYVLVADVRRELGTRIAVSREHLLNVPGKCGWQCVGKDRAEIEHIMRQEIHDALDNIADPTSWDRRRDQAGRSGRSPS
jgi:hypothetical protein